MIPNNENLISPFGTIMFVTSRNRTTLPRQSQMGLTVFFNWLYVLYYKKENTIFTKLYSLGSKNVPLFFRDRGKHCCIVLANELVHDFCPSVCCWKIAYTELKKTC